MSQLFDAAYYRSQYGLPRWVPSPLARLHYSLVGARRGVHPSAFFDPGYFAGQIARRNLTPVGPRRLLRAYETEPAYWSCDPHPFVAFPHETFASQESTANPLSHIHAQSAITMPFGIGHPLLDARWWIETRELPADASLATVLLDVAQAVTNARANHEIVQLSHELDVLFINGEDHCPACTQYRVWSPAIALRAAGLRVAIIDSQDLVQDRFNGIRIDARAVMVFRTTVNGRLRAFLHGIRARGSRIGFDCDDLIFDRPHTVGLQPGEFGFRDGTAASAHAAAMQPIIDDADFALVPTQTIARALADRGMPGDSIWVCPSFLSPSQLTAVPPAATRTPEAQRTLSMASGTWTHQEDFRDLAAPLADALASHPNLRLRVFGALDLSEFPALSDVGEQITRDPNIIRDWGRYVQRYCEGSMNLICMDADNGFCHGKSEVKYIEAGLAGVATMATGTEALSRALGQHGEALIIHSPSQWGAALERLAAAPEIAVEAGRAAHADVVHRYGPDGTYAKAYVDAVRAVLDDAPRATRQIPNRWALSEMEPSEVVPPHLFAAAQATGASGFVAHREPRESDLYFALDGTPVIASAADDRGSSLLLPWVDPCTFFRRAHPASIGQLHAIALLVPVEAMGHDTARALAPRARVWRDADIAKNARFTVIGRRGADLGMPRARYWLPGGSDVELATLLREVDLAVQLCEGNWSEALVGALAVGTPVAVSDSLAGPHKGWPDGWREPRPPTQR